MSTRFQNYSALLLTSLQLNCSKNTDLHYFLYSDAPAIDLTLHPTSNSLHIKILVPIPSSSSNVFCSSMDDRLVSLNPSFCDFPFSKISHNFFLEDSPKSTLLTLAYNCPSCLFPLPFRRSQSLAKSPSSNQMSGSTKLSPNESASKSYLSLSAPTGLHNKSLRRNTPLRTSVQFGISFLSLPSKHILLPVQNQYFSFLSSHSYPCE